MNDTLLQIITDPYFATLIFLTGTSFALCSGRYMRRCAVTVSMLTSALTLFSVTAHAGVLL